MNPNPSLQSLRESVNTFVKQAKQASALPTDPDHKGAAPMPPDKDRAATAPSTPGREQTNTPMVGTDDKAGLGVTNPGEGPKVQTQDGNQLESVTKMAKLQQSLATLVADSKTAAGTAPEAAKVAGEVQTPAAPAAPAAPIDQEQAKLAYQAFAAVGAAITSTERGRAIVEAELQKQAGEKRAAELMQEAVKAAAVYEAIGEHIAAEHEQGELEKQAFAELLGSLSEDQRAAVIEMADVREKAAAAGIIKDQIDLYFFSKGASMAEAMTAGGPQAEADPAAGMPGAGEQPSPEDITAAVMEAVASGQITEEDAKAMLAEYGIPWPGEADAGAADGAAEADPAQKAASELLASVLEAA
jgi:hypothetical protein